MATFAELKTAISKRLIDASNIVVSSADVGASINDAIGHWKQKKFWFNEKTQSVTLTEGNPVVPNFPSDFLFPITGGFTINYAQTRWPITIVNSHDYDLMNVEGKGLPEFITYRAGQWELYWYPDQAYTLVIRYVKDYTDLSADGDNNDFTNNAADLIKYEALSRLHGELRQDPRMEEIYAVRAQREYNNLIERSNKQLGTGILSVTTI